MKGRWTEGLPQVGISAGPYMVEQILPDIYRIEIPLPNSPLKALNSYVIMSQGRFLVVDTGWNKEECLVSMLSGLKALKVDLNKTDFFITHVHSDHMALVERLVRPRNRVYLGKKDASVAVSLQERGKDRFEHLLRTYLSYGFPKGELLRAVENHPGFRDGFPASLAFSTLRDGETIDVGDYSFRCIETPGHSPGHMCLYEERKKILLSGDHILSDITPNITRWPEMENSLGEYLRSLEKIYSFDVELLLPGHRRMMTNHRKRIAELIRHHKRRLDEALGALGDGEKTAWEVAPNLSWDMDYRCWELFPPVQKWFALGETVAHLRYLEAVGSIKSRQHKDRLLFSLK
jgi:glyoxylase-like metal-dependent hydrolase (beta-lactamase superfamily II)